MLLMRIVFMTWSVVFVLYWLVKPLDCPVSEKKGTGVCSSPRVQA